MKVYSKGVLPSSEIYFHTPSETARNLFFYPLCVGHYWCSGEYRVDRSSYNSYLALFVEKGTGYVQVDGRRRTVGENSVFLLDCYQPHIYGSEEGWEIYWLLFDGTQAQAYFRTLCPISNCLVMTPPDPRSVRRSLVRIYNLFHDRGKVSESMVNKYTVSLLTDFFTGSPATADRGESVSEELLSYIAENLEQPLTLTDLARRASLSPYHFTRQFKKETGYTPHEYIIFARVNAAKYYLKTTSLPAKAITHKCGFSSEAAFCTTFKRVVGVTPLEYRRSSL